MRESVTSSAMEPAPLNPGEVKAVLEPFGSSMGLPAEAYRSDAVFAWEREHFLAGTWFCLGRVDELVGPGQARAVPVAGEAVLLVRDEETVRAFSNVCRHRGHELMPVGDAADVRLIRCPYHSWTYRLDGTLKTAPTFSGRAGFDAADYPLVPVAAETRGGWLWCSLSGGSSLDDHLGNVSAVLAPYRSEDLITGHVERYTVQANWKVIVENFNECYHCTSIHPELCEVTPVDSGTDLSPTGLWCGGTMELKPHAVTMSLDGTSPVEPLPGIDGDRLRRVAYLSLFPNLLVSAHPDYVLAHRLTPTAPERTEVECTWLFAEAGIDPSFAVDFWDITNREDWAVCEGVQRGMANFGHRQGPLSTWEATVYQFLTMVGRAYLGEGLSPSPVESRSSSPPPRGGDEGPR